jgi:hypothetical protein
VFDSPHGKKLIKLQIWRRRGQEGLHDHDEDFDIDDNPRRQRPKSWRSLDDEGDGEDEVLNDLDDMQDWQEAEEDNESNTIQLRRGGGSRSYGGGYRTSGGSLFSAFKNFFG